MAGSPLGEIIYAAVKPIIRMYMIIGTGFFLTRKGLFGVTAARACSDMVLMIFMPALVFDKIVSYISISDIKTIGVICFSAFIMYVINACVAFFIVKFTPVPKDPKNRWVGGALLAGIMQNVSDLPIAYIQAVSVFSTTQQNKGTAYVIIWLAMYVVAQFNCGLFQLVEWDFKYTDKYYHNGESNDGPTDLEKNGDASTTNTSIDPSNETGTATAVEKSDDDNGNRNGNRNDNLTTSSSDNDDDDNSDTVNIDDSNMPNIYTPTTISSLANESPVSPTSSIASSIDQQQQQHPQQHQKKLSEELNPRPLTLVASKLSQLSRATSRTSAIARIPSARNMNYADGDPDNADDVMSLNQELIREYSRIEPFNKKMSKSMKIITETNLTMKDVEEAGTNISFIKKYHLHYLVFFLQNFKKPNSVSLVISIIIALIPWVKALFVNTGTVTVSNAPDNEPALSFILMYAEYLGYPCVPLGLLLIGSVLARLEFSDIPKGFWKSAVCHTLFRLAILPIIGAALITRFKNVRWLTDPMAMFVCSMEFALPSATVQIYLTAGAMRPGDKTCSPLNCFGLYLALQYVVLVVSMPIVVCYCIKKTMDM